MIESPENQWAGYKKMAYGETLLPPAQEKACSECFYAGMMAGLTSTTIINHAYSGAKKKKEVRKFMNEIKFVALRNNPTGNN